MLHRLLLVLTAACLATGIGVCPAQEAPPAEATDSATAPTNEGETDESSAEQAPPEESTDDDASQAVQPAAESEAHTPAALEPLAPGQADLEKAVELKLTARGLRELNTVIELLDQAVDKGLDEGSTPFANSMLASSLMQRATLMSAAVLNRRQQPSQQGDLRWIQVRQLALTDLQRAVDIDAKLVEAYLLIGRLQLTPLGDPNAARRALSKVIDADSETVKPTDLAQAYVLRGAQRREPDKRLADFTRAVELDPSKVEYLIIRAREHQQRKDFEAAVVDADAALAIAPENAGAHELKALVLLAQDKPAEAIKSFDRATELAPNALGPYQYRGEAYNRLGDRQKAIEQLDKAIELDPNNAGSRLVRSQLRLMDGQNEAALKDVESVLARQPGLLRAHILRVQVLEELGRIDDALEALRRIAQAAADRPEVLLQLSLIYQSMGENEAAIEVLTGVIEQADDNTTALRLRGDLYLAIGDHTRALADFARAYEIEPDDTGLLNNYAWALATSPFDELRDGPRAIELATRAAELTEYEKPHILSTLAAAYAESGDFDRAIEYAEKAVGLEKEIGAGPEGGDDIASQLAAELESYREGKPWRELQQAGEEQPAPPETPDDSPAAPPATAENLDRAFDF